MSTTKSSTGFITAAELARVIDDAALFADKSRMMPTINAIRLESTAKQLIAIGTDRFTLARQWLPMTRMVARSSSPA